LCKVLFTDESQLFNSAVPARPLFFVSFRPLRTFSQISAVDTCRFTIWTPVARTRGTKAAIRRALAHFIFYRSSNCSVVMHLLIGKFKLQFTCICYHLHILVWFKLYTLDNYVGMSIADEPYCNMDASLARQVGQGVKNVKSMGL
jgi:hypothetical protein